MHNLLHWLQTTKQHPLITSSVFHYEFEFIHPFTDGNGRMGRLWQTLILYHWNPLFSHIPVENLINENQTKYYQTLKQSTEQSNCAPFIEFILKMIINAISSATTPQVTPQVKHLLQTLDKEMSRKELQNALSLQDRKSFQQRYLKPALENNLIEMTLPNKPNSRLQKYRLTKHGQQWLKNKTQGY